MRISDWSSDGCSSDLIDARDWSQVIWAISTRVDPVRDSVLVDRTPIDYLDFSSPTPGLGSKLGLDATNKWPGETTRAWSRPIELDPAVEKRVDALWGGLCAPRGASRPAARRGHPASA